MTTTPDSPSRAEALDLIRIYRDSAHRYVSLRTNATYLNLAATGAVTTVVGAGLLGVPDDCIPQFLDSHIVIYLTACAVLCAFGGWATAMASSLTNSINRYMHMATELEINVLGVSYDQYRNPDVSVTPEFVPDLSGKIQRAFTDDIWNLINVCVACYALLMAAAIGYITSDHRTGLIILIGGCAVYFSIVIYSLAATDLPVWAYLRGRVRTWKKKTMLTLLFVTPFLLLFGASVVAGFPSWAGTSVSCYDAIGSVQELHQIQFSNHFAVLDDATK